MAQASLSGCLREVRDGGRTPPMRFRGGLLLLTLLFVAACSGGDGSASPSQPPIPSATLDSKYLSVVRPQVPNLDDATLVSAAT